MQNKLLLSFIVPFYNVENYIEECIRSLYNQDIPITDYEVIAINDCSTDSSRSLVSSLQKEYSTLILLDHKINKRQGGARNTGLKHAQGEYIWFVDSDDFLKQNVLKHLMKILIDYQLQILHFDYVYVKPDGFFEEAYIDNYTSKVLSGKLFIHHEGDLWWKKSIEVWRRIHKREFLIQNNLLFDENVFYEDFIYSLKTLYITDSIMHVPEKPYCYRVNPDSFTNSNITGIKLSESVKLSIRCIDFSIFLKIVDFNFVETLISFAVLQLKIAKNGLIFLSQNEKDIYFKQIRNEETKKFKPLLKKIDYLLITDYFFSKFFLSIFKPLYLIKRRWRK